MLKRFQTGFGADAPAVLHELDGDDHVAIAAGGNSLRTTAYGDAVWVFSLKCSSYNTLAAAAPGSLNPEDRLQEPARDRRGDSCVRFMIRAISGPRFPACLGGSCARRCGASDSAGTSW